MAEEPEEPLEDALVKSLELPDLKDALVEVGEVGLDRLLDDGVLRDIPVLGVLVRLRTTLGVVRDHLFARKVARFLTQLGRIPPDERSQFLRDVERRGEQRRLGDTLVLLLDRLDDLEKPQLLARLFGAYIQGRYDFATFRRLSTALDRLPLVAVPALRAFYSEKSDKAVQEGEYLEQFAFAGLVETRFFVLRSAGAGGGYFQNSLGAIFVEVIEAA